MRECRACGFLKAQGRPRIGGIIYAESARKAAYFVETAERLGQPLIYPQDGRRMRPEVQARIGGRGADKRAGTDSRAS